jgi:hypothetical protein
MTPDAIFWYGKYQQLLSQTENFKEEIKILKEQRNVRVVLFDSKSIIPFSIAIGVQITFIILLTLLVSSI